MNSSHNAARDGNYAINFDGTMDGSVIENVADESVELHAEGGEGVSAYFSVVFFFFSLSFSVMDRSSVSWS